MDNILKSISENVTKSDDEKLSDAQWFALNSYLSVRGLTKNIQNTALTCTRVIPRNCILN
jgi:hypothetical protein